MGTTHSSLALSFCLFIGVTFSFNMPNYTHTQPTEKDQHLRR
ncbi:hypothetical protein HMPREF6745_1475 [Prevotella sp. oral taxon 472 str. F0295]|nr:hypothetical protein HMPREF6745_1475 [Prevotella sp. oral taxon 472 str. F0295]